MVFEEERRVLVVEDDPDFAEGLVHLLESEGYRTAVAHCRQDALDVIRGFDPAVAIIDVQLGSEDGVAVMSELQTIRPKILCLVVTAHATLQSAIAAVRGAARDYLRKPFEPTTLLAALDGCFETLRLREEKRIAENNLASQTRFLERLNFTLFRLVQSLNGESQATSPDGATKAETALQLSDEAGRLTYVDTAYSALTGWGQDEVRDKPIHAMVDELSRRDVDELVASAQQAQCSTARVGLRHRNGSVVVVTMTSVPMFDTDKRFRGMCAVVAPSPQRVSTEFARPNADELGAADRINWLTHRQAEVLTQALRGGCVGDIAREMSLSEHTVRSHIKAIYRKLGVSSRAELAARFGGTKGPAALVIDERQGLR